MFAKSAEGRRDIYSYKYSRIHKKIPDAVL